MEFSTNFSEKPTRRFRLNEGERGSPIFTTARTLRRIHDAGRCRNSSSSRFRARHSGAPAPIPAPSVRCGRRRLGSRAIGRLWRFVARARPFARIAPRRRLRSRHRRPCRATTCTDSFLHSRPSPALRSRAFAPTALAPFKRVKSDGLRPPRFGYAQSPLGFGCSLSLHRSRIRSEQSHTQRAA